MVDKLTIEGAYEEQIKFQKALGSPVIQETLSPEERNEQYRNHCLFTIEEIIEGLRCINHKPWKQSQVEDNLEELKTEIIDEFRFMINRCVLIGLSPDEFEELFRKSFEKTYNRLKNGY